MTTGSLAVVERWLQAVNDRDGAMLESLSGERIEISGPRGNQSTDRSVLSEWLLRSGFSASSLHWFCGGDGSVVVEQDAVWDDVATGEAQDRRRIASRFNVVDGVVVRYSRHDAGLQDALAAADLTDADEVVHQS